MMAVGALKRTEIKQGLRPFDPLRDILPVAELIELAFAVDLETEAREMLQGMRAAASVAPLWGLLDRLLSLGDYFSGYVWVEEGKIVGNTTLTRAGLGRRDCVISNVAVHPAYRRRGIARQMMEAAIQAARQRGAPWVVLEVRQDNYAAKALYEQLGFVVVDAHSVLMYEGWLRSDYPQTDLPIRVLKVEEEGKVDRLRLESTSPWTRRLDGEPSPPDPTWWIRASRLWGILVWGEDRLTWGWFDGDDLSAALTLRATRWGAKHALELWARPERQGHAERALIARALSALGKYPRRPTRATLRPSYPQAVESLRRMGFRHLRTLERMILELGD